MSKGLKKRRLGRTGLEVTEIGLGGAWLLGRQGDADLDAGVATVHRALELGINFLDTAECYIGGKSESVLGAALEMWEGEVFVATKFGHVPDGFDFSREAVVESARKSMRMLGRSADLFQLHTPPEIPMDLIAGPNGALEGMREVQERGWCRFLGTTGRDPEFLRRCIETDAFDTVLFFNVYDLWGQTAKLLLEEAAAHDMGILIGSPLRMGLFGSAREGMRNELSPEDQKKLDDLETRYAGEPGGVAGAALRFVLEPPEVSVVLSGAASPEEIENSVRFVRAGGGDSVETPG